MNLTPGNGTKSIFIYAEPDSKGKAVEERYEFYLNDLDAASVNFKVTREKIASRLQLKEQDKVHQVF